MIREIKFRGCSCGEWYYGNLYIRKHEEFGDYAYIIGYTENLPTTIVDINTIGQFTGLYDKNGKEIYEGDIVRTDVSRANATKNKTYRNFAIRYNAPHFWNGYDTLLMAEWRMEVIGNIYENPELLKQK